MAKYFVSTHPAEDGFHEVHKAGCKHQPPLERRRNLGDHFDCKNALEAAKQFFPQVKGCSECGKEAQPA